MVYNSVAFRILTMLYNNLFSLVTKHFHPKRKHIPTKHFLFPLSRKPGNYEGAIGLYSLPIWEISYRWNPTIHRLLCLASFT